MVDSRLREEWLGHLRFDSISDQAWRVFTDALMWSNKNGTDGYIPSRYLKTLHPEGELPRAFQELQSVDVWSETETGFQLNDWAGALGQSLAEHVVAYKANAAARAAAHRRRVNEKLKKSTGSGTAGSSPTYVSSQQVAPGVTRDVRLHVGTGTGVGEGARTGTGVGEGARTGEGSQRLPASGEVSPTWNVRQPGTEDWARELPPAG